MTAKGIFEAIGSLCYQKKSYDAIKLKSYVPFKAESSFSELQMAQPYPTKDILNTIYHSAITTTLAVSNAVIGHKLIKLCVGNPARPNLTEMVKLKMIITTDDITKDALIKYKLLPTDIISK